jgi:hypothetical protein
VREPQLREGTEGEVTLPSPADVVDGMYSCMISKLFCRLFEGETGHYATRTQAVVFASGRR